MTRWPNATETELWTFAVNYPVDKWNATLLREDIRFLSPNKVFSGQSEDDTTQDLSKMFHVWGCPILGVLKYQLQDGKAFPKWYRNISRLVKTPRQFCCSSSQSKH